MTLVAHKSALIVLPCDASTILNFSLLTNPLLFFAPVVIYRGFCVKCIFERFFETKGRFFRFIGFYSIKHTHAHT